MRIQILLTIILSLIVAIPSYSDELNRYDKVEEALGLGLPVVEVITKNGAEPSCDYVTSPEGSWGEGITNAEKIPGSLKIYNEDGSLRFSSGEYVKGQSGMTIKVRGNTSAYADKKPFKIKLQKKADLLGRDNKKFQDKSWNLLSDPHMLHFLGFHLSEIMESDWTPSVEYVNLILNGNFRGIYLLTESVERNEDCRINVAESGFIVEHDPYWWNENGEYIGSLYDPEYNYTFKYPDYADLTGDNKMYVSSVLDSYEKSVLEGTYSEKIDLESFAKWLLAHDILGTYDGGGVNVYITKYDSSSESLLKIGPLWDFDSSGGTQEAWSGVHSTKRFNRLFQNKNPEFVKAYIKLWQEIGKRVFEEMYSFVESLNDASLWEAYDKSTEADMIRWNKENSLAWEVNEWAANWYSSRFPWLQKSVERLAEEAFISAVSKDETKKVIINKNSITPLASGMSIDIFSIEGKHLYHYISQEGDPIMLSIPGIFLVRVDGDTFKIRVY